MGYFTGDIGKSQHYYTTITVLKPLGYPIHCQHYNKHEADCVDAL